jgi:O-antigen ligase
MLPILAFPFLCFYFDVTPKVAALLFAVSIACCLGLRRVRWSGADRNARFCIGLLTMQAVFLTVSTAASTMPALSFSGSNWRRFGLVTQLGLLVIFLLAALGPDARSLLSRMTLRVIAITGTLISIYAVLQYFGWDPLLPSAAYHIGEGEWTIVRPPGTIGHADYLGGYLVFVVFLGGSLLVREVHRIWRLIGAFSAMLGLFAIVLSGTRSALVGVAVGVALLTIRLGRNFWRAGIAVLLCAIALGGFYYSPLGQKLRSRARWYREDPKGGARLLLWRDTLRMAASRPILGWGPETFSTEFPKFQSLELARAYPDFYHESPHNIILDELVSKGLPGALVFLAWIGLAAMAAWRALKRPKEAPLGAAFLAGLVCLQFNAFVLVTAFLFYLTGVALLMAESAETAVETRPPSLWIRFAGFILATVFLIFAVRLCMADVLLARVRTLLEAGNVPDAAIQYEAVRNWQLPGMSSDLYYSRNMSANVRRQRDLLTAVKAWQEAVQAGIRATEFAEDRHNAFYNLASIYAGLNDHPDAERNLRSAAASAPNWFKPHWMLARVLQAGGRRKEALAEAEAAVERDANKHQEVNETLRQLREQQ